MEPTPTRHDTAFLVRTERLVVRTRWSGPTWSPWHGRYVSGPIDVYGTRRHYRDVHGGTVVLTHDDAGRLMDETYTAPEPERFRQ